MTSIWDSGRGRTVLLTGATGFVGAALDPLLVEAGYDVRRASRRPPAGDPSWVELDVSRPETIERALAGCDCCLYLIHRMDSAAYETEELQAAESFRAAAERQDVRRIVYLGGVAPSAGAPSKHLRSRLGSGEVLRAGTVSTLELRAGMIIGEGSASWRIVRDLAARLPLMVLPRWLGNRSQPIALDDVLLALLTALQDPIEGSAWFDLPGPETMTGRQILERVAALFGISPVMIPVPLLTPRLSAHWLRLVTRTNMQLAYQLVEGLTNDLVATGPDYWERVHDRQKISFDEAAGGAIAQEDRKKVSGGGRAVERLVRLLSRRARRRR